MSLTGLTSRNGFIRRASINSHNYGVLSNFNTQLAKFVIRFWCRLTLLHRNSLQKNRLVGADIIETMTILTITDLKDNI